MEEISIYVLWITGLVFPVVIFLVFRPRSRLYQLVAAIVAVGAGWIFNVAYAVAAQSITAASHAEINGAASAFALVLGWVIPAVSVCVTWLVWHVLLRPRRDERVASSAV